MRRKSLCTVNKRENFTEHLREFHLCESTSDFLENRELNLLHLELDVLTFVLKDCYLRTLLGSDKNF